MCAGQCVIKHVVDSTVLTTKKAKSCSVANYEPYPKIQLLSAHFLNHYCRVEYKKYLAYQKAPTCSVCPAGRPSKFDR